MGLGSFKAVRLVEVFDTRKTELTPAHDNTPPRTLTTQIGYVT